MGAIFLILSVTPILRCIDYYLFIFGTRTTYLSKMLTILISFYFLVLLSYLSNGTPRYIEHLFTTIAFSILSLRRLPFFVATLTIAIYYYYYYYYYFVAKRKMYRKKKNPLILASLFLLITRGIETYDL